MRSLRLRGEGILITRSGPRPTLRLGFRLSGSATGWEALPGDGFTPRRIFDRLSAAGMTEGRVRGWQRAGQGGSRTAPTWDGMGLRLGRYDVEGTPLVGRVVEEVI